MNNEKTIGVKNCSMNDRKKIQAICAELGVETYNIDKVTKHHPDLRLATDNVVENVRDMDDETDFISTGEFINKLREKFSKN